MTLFKAPDGTEFTKKSDLRKYLMTNFYSYKNRSNELLTKKDGDINGQAFEIGDCDNCTITILDFCEQIQIDNAKNCRIFIGACKSSIFIRNCSDCVFYCSCRQLRLRDVIKSSFYSFSMSEIHIEFSNNLLFGPFLGGYPEHAEHLKKANLNIQHNLWYDIYDHNDPDKSHVNWKLIPEFGFADPWFPAGPCAQAIPTNFVGSVMREVDTGLNALNMPRSPPVQPPVIKLDEHPPILERKSMVEVVEINGTSNIGNNTPSTEIVKIELLETKSEGLKGFEVLEKERILTLMTKFLVENNEQMAPSDAKVILAGGETMENTGIPKYSNICVKDISLTPTGNAAWGYGIAESAVDNKLDVLYNFSFVLTRDSSDNTRCSGEIGNQNSWNIAQLHFSNHKVNL